jgi:hypothetical protein
MIPSGESAFLDANPFLHYFTAHPRYGAAAKRLLDCIVTRNLTGFISGFPAQYGRSECVLATDHEQIPDGL